MKITKVQLNALASEIADSIKQEINTHNQLVYSSEEYLNFFNNDDCEMIKLLANGYGVPESNTNIFLASLRTNHFKDRIKYLPHYLQTNIEREIIIKTIEGDDLTDIISQIKLKFS